MKTVAAFIVLCIATASLRADSAVTSWYNQRITVWLAKFDKDGYATKDRAIGTGTKVVIPSDVIAQFRGNMNRGQFPAVGLLIECTPPAKLKNGQETDGRFTCQIEDGVVVSYRLNPEDGGVGMDYRFGVYP